MTSASSAMVRRFRQSANASAVYSYNREHRAQTAERRKAQALLQMALASSSTRGVTAAIPIRQKNSDDCLPNVDSRVPTWNETWGLLAKERAA